MKKKPLRHRHKKHAGHHILGVKGTIVLAIVSIFAFGVTAVYTTSYLGSGDLAAVISSVLVDLTNTDRSSENIGTLTVSPVLTAAAQAKANDMAAKGYFAHVSPDGRNSWYWFSEAGYSFTYAGENLAVDFTDSDAVDTAWMNSPTHRANILNAHFTQIGIATAVGTYKGHKTTFVVQMFGAPATVAVGPAEALNSSSQPAEIAVAKTTVLGTAAKTQPVVATKTPAATPANTNDAPATPSVTAPVPQASLIAYLETTPETLLRDLYILIGLLLVVTLASITGFEFRRHHMRHVYAAAFVLVLMVGLYTAADALFFSDTIIGEASSQTGNG